MNSGFWYALGAYIIWGVLPIYWKWLQQVPAIQVIGHRICWSFILLLGYVLATRQWRLLRSAIKPRVVVIYGIASILLSINWLIYIWAVNAGYVVETSLGYFINPLLNLLLGMLFLDERLRPAQWIPVGLATSGVLYLTLTYGSLPWIALSLAVTFGLYGLVKKIAPLGSLYGLTLETGFVFLPAVCYLTYVELHGQGGIGNNDLQTGLLLAGAGVVTTTPLLLFASATKRITLTMVGIMQYIAPTIQFLLGVFVFHEAFTRTRLVGFAMVWIALLIFWFEGAYARQRLRIGRG